jgi:hypothetical protein
LSDLKIELPDFILSPITQIRSIIGTAITKRAVAIFVPAKIARVARINPINIDPEVPARILDGWKLKIKNPKSAPDRAMVIIPTGG